MSLGDELLAQARRAAIARPETTGCHMPLIPPVSRLSMTYPTARIRGRRITRLPEKYLDWAILDAATADELGREHVGWFVGNHAGLARTAEQLGRLDANPEGGIWVVVPLGREKSTDLRMHWPHRQHINEPTDDAAVWQSRKVWVAIPEDLRQLLPLARKVEAGIAGVIILDPLCLLYKARGGTDRWGKKHRSDRPRHVVNFRAALDSEGWQPPLLLLTEKPAKSVNTEVVARAFCLNSFRFIAGDLFDCWDEPIG
jgi:hypothetical protein